MSGYNKIILFVTSAVLALLPLPASADGESSFLDNLQKRDSVLIGDQVRYGFRAAVPEGSTVNVGELEESEGIEIIRGFALDTLKTRRGNVYLEGNVIITSFDSGAFVLPRYDVEVVRPDGSSDTLHFGQDTLHVTTIPVDTASFVLNDIKPQIGYPVTAMEILPWVAGVIAVALIVWLVVWLLGRRGIVRNVPKEPAHITALRKLDSYRGNKLWEPAKQKMFYTGVTDAVREYIDARYGISAMEMTTAEIFTELKDKDIAPGLYEDLKTLFERADFVKFAKYVASEQENTTAVPVAVKFVNETYQQEIETSPEKGDDNKK